MREGIEYLTCSWHSIVTKKDRCLWPDTINNSIWIVYYVEFLPKTLMHLLIYSNRDQGEAEPTQTNSAIRKGSHDSQQGQQEDSHQSSMSEERRRTQVVVALGGQQVANMPLWDAKSWPASYHPEACVLGQCNQSIAECSPLEASKSFSIRLQKDVKSTCCLCTQMNSQGRGGRCEKHSFTLLSEHQPSTKCNLYGPMGC